MAKFNDIPGRHHEGEGIIIAKEVLQDRCYTEEVQMHCSVILHESSVVVETNSDIVHDNSEIV